MRMQEKVGIRSHHCSVIATDIKQKVDEEVADAEGPSTSCKSGRVTLCVEGNISAGKSTFLNWVAQGHPELDGMLEVPGMWQDAVLEPVHWTAWQMQAAGLLNCILIRLPELHLNLLKPLQT